MYQIQCLVNIFKNQPRIKISWGIVHFRYIAWCDIVHFHWRKNFITQVRLIHLDSKLSLIIECISKNLVFPIFLEMFFLILQMYHKLFSDHLWSGRICIRKGLRSCFPQECSIITWTWFNFHFSNSISLNSNARELRVTWVEYHIYYSNN